MTNPIVFLPDGYNGHVVAVYSNPIEIWADGTVKLQCAPPIERCFKWARHVDVEKAIRVQASAGQAQER